MRWRTPKKPVAQAPEKQGTFVPRDQVSFHPGPVPVLSLALSPDQFSLLPPTEAEGGWPLPPLPGWRLVPRLTLCVLDGPDGGFLAQAVAYEHELEAMTEWLQSVDAAGGALVLARPGGTQPPDLSKGAEPAYREHGLHGGWVEVMVED